MEHRVIPDAVNPIHVALMHNGKILVVAGSGNCPPSQSGCPSGPPYGPSNSSGALVLDPAAQNITQLTVAWDMFCNAMTVLADGRVMVNGGTIAYDPFQGIQKTCHLRSYPRTALPMYKAWRMDAGIRLW